GKGVIQRKRSLHTLETATSPSDSASLWTPATIAWRVPFALEFCWLSRSTMGTPGSSSNGLDSGEGPALFLLLALGQKDVELISRPFELAGQDVGVPAKGDR